MSAPLQVVAGLSGVDASFLTHPNWLLAAAARGALHGDVGRAVRKLQVRFMLPGRCLARVVRVETAGCGV